MVKLMSTRRVSFLEKLTVVSVASGMLGTMQRWLSLVLITV
jgi:hypothetical protein